MINLIIITPIIILILNYLLIKKNFLQSLTGDKHQLFVEKKNVPLSGGLVIFLLSFYMLNFQIKMFYLIFILIFLIGLLSDIKFIISAKKRFLFQVLTIFVFVFYYDFSISNVKVFFIDYFLIYKIFSYLFVTFCLLIVVNGTNFLDGLNGLVLGYYIIVIYTLFNSDLFSNYFNLDNYLLKFLIILIFLLVFNYLNKLYLGDSGSYLLGLVIGVFLIFTYNNFKNISPFFIVLLLWYPCFENLFSILRKFKLKRSPIEPDNNHLHQLIFFYLKKKYKTKNIFANNCGSLIILLYNLIIFGLGIQNISNTQYQIILLILNLFIYCAIYFKLFAYKYNLKT